MALDEVMSVSPAIGAPLVAQKLKSPPAMQEAQIWTLGLEDPLKKGIEWLSPAVYAHNFPLEPNPTWLSFPGICNPECLNCCT